MAEETVPASQPFVAPKPAVAPAPAGYSGTERRNLGSPNHPPALVGERRKTPWPAPVKAAPKVSLRAKFTVSEVTKTGRGVSVLTLGAQHDHTIKGDAVMLPGSVPKGSISIEVDPKYADQVPVGSAFYLVSA